MGAYRIRYRILVPFAIIMLAVVAGFVATAYQYEDKFHRQTVSEDLAAAQRLFRRKTESDTQLLGAVLLTLMENETLRRLYASRDRQALLSAATPLFDRIAGQYRISHFYFLEPDRRVFLRVHQPDRLGDVIRRRTAIEAAKTGTASAGLELGPLGTFTLRAVTPWKDGERLLGYLELGIEIEAVVQDIRSVLKEDLLVLARKELLVKDDWAAGMKMLGRLPDWDQLPQDTVSASTLASIPPALLDWLARERESLGSAEIRAGGRVLLAGALPLVDIGGRTIGRVVLVNDDTASHFAFMRTFLTVAVASLLVGAGVFIGFRQVLLRVEGDVGEAWTQLEDRVRERTHDLTTEIERRQRSEQALVRAKEELERVAQVAAHDLQEPARSVVSFAQLLERRYGDKLGPEGREYLDFLVHDAHRMRNLVRDLLAYVQLWEGGSLALEPVDTGRIVEAAVRRLRSELDAHGARVDAAPDLPVIAANPSLLTELFRQLIDNALKFRVQNRSPEIAVTAAPAAGDWEFSFADNGMGIEAEYLDKVFVAFRRLHAGTAFGGTGIGLAMARRIVERHGGRIWAESELDKGTVIRFTLPGTPLSDAKESA